MMQVDVTSKTEGKAFADATGVPLLVKYDTRLRDNVAKNIVQDVTTQVQVGIVAHALPAHKGRACVQAIESLPVLQCCLVERFPVSPREAHDMSLHTAALAASGWRSAVVRTDTGGLYKGVNKRSREWSERVWGMRK